MLSLMSLRTMLLPALIATLFVSVIPCFARPGQSGSTGGAPGRAIDRVIASVDGMAITQSDVENEYRMEVFLEDGRVTSTAPDATTLSRVLERVIDQKLLMHEAGAEHTDLAASQQRAEQTLADLRHKFASEEAFHAALQSLGLNEHDLLARIEEQELVLHIVDQRMRPLVSVGQDEMEAYYRTTFLPEWKKKSKENAPALAEVEAQIQEILAQKKIDQQLEVWLKELRAAHQVRVVGPTVGPASAGASPRPTVGTSGAGVAHTSRMSRSVRPSEPHTWHTTPCAPPSSS
jgi:hypothetical protein